MASVHFITPVLSLFLTFASSSTTSAVLVQQDVRPPPGVGAKYNPSEGDTDDENEDSFYPSGFGPDEQEEEEDDDVLGADQTALGDCPQLPSTENWLRQYGRRATFAIDRVLARQERRAKLMNYTPFDNALVGTAGGGGLSTLDDTAGGSSAGSCPPRSVIPGYRGESLRSQIRQQFAKALPREAFPPPERVEYSADGKRCLQASDSASYFATVPSNSDEEKMLKALMRTRFNARGTSWSSGRDRDEAVEGIDLSDPKKFAAFRLHNAKSLQRYERRREQLAKKLAKMGRSGAVGLGAASSSHLSDQEDAGDTTATSPISIWTERPFAMRVIQEHLGKRQGTIPLAKAPVQWEMANEIFALHATSSPKIVEPIAKMGLKISNSEGLFGEGKIFGAADIAKSDQYCTTPGQMPKALFRHLRKLVRMEAFWSQDAKNEYRNQQFCLVFVARMTMGDTRVVNRYAYAEELLQTEFFPGVLKRDSAFHDVLTGRRKDSVSYYSPSFVGHPEGDGALGSKLEKSFAEEQTYITFDEYVLEDARQIYLEYAIFYTRAPLPEVEGEAAARLVEQRKPFHYFSAFETGTYYSEAEKVWNLVLSRGVCHPLQRDEWTGIREGLRQFLRARMPSHLLSKRGQFDRHNVEEWSQMARYASRLKRRFAKRMLATVNRAHFASVLADQVPAGEAWLLGRTENEAMASADAFLRPWELRQRERLRTLQTLIHTKTTVESRRIWDNLDPATRSYCEQIAKLEGMCIFADLLIAKARADPEAGHCVANYLFPPTPTALLVSLLPADAENRMRSIIHQHYKLAKDTTHEDTKLSCIRAQECRDGVLGCGRSFQLHMEVVESTENGDKHLDLSDPLLLSREGKRTEVVVFNPDVLPNLPPLLLFNVPDSDAAQKLTWCHTSMFLRAEAVWKEGRRVWREHGHHGNHYLMEMEIFDRSSSGLSGSQDPPAFDHTSVLKSLPDISTEGRAGLTALDYIARLFSSADRSSTTSGTRTPSATSAEQVEQQLIKHNKRVLSKVGGGNAILPLHHLMVLRTFAGYQTWQYEDAFRTGITRGVAPDPFQITADSWIPVQTAKGFAGMVDLFGMTDFSPEVVVPFAFLHPVIGAAQRGFLEVPDLLARTLFVEMVMGGTGSGTVWPFEVVFSEWMSYFQSSSTSADVHVPPLPVVKEVGIPPSQHFTTPALAAPLEIHQCPTTTPVQASPDAFQESTTPVDPGSSKVIVLPFARELRGLLKSSEASSHLEDLPGKPKNFSPTAVRHAALSGIFEREDCLADGFSKTSVFYEFSSEPMRRVQAEFADTMDEITDMAKQQEDPGTCRCVAHMERVPAVFNHRKSFRQSAQRGGVLFSSAFMGEQERTPVVSSSSSTSSPVPEWSFNPTSWSGSTSSPVPEWSFNPDPPVDVHSPVPTGAASAMDRSVPPELRVASSENGRWSFPQWVAMWKQITIPTLKKVQKKLCTQVYPYVKHQVEVEKRESSGWARLFERLNHRTVALCKAPEFDYLQRDDAEPVQVGGPRPGEARTTIVDWLSKEVKRSSLGSSGAGGATTEAGEVDDSEELELGAGGTGDFIHRVSI